ncbi:hypothetical protein ACFFU1_13320 [Algibacter miyuki]|uniref:Uncharacterized protein n=1 Tax=Algibacter miyuki TaxID=1306933 RepID=A0ABV5H335_9FLAO|nr:hypothetical protein [Algibacter miyuki]MDN3666493.1 hypothetical protein [Algibacter miyuki]
MAHLNSHKEICNLFKRIENKFPVDQWKVNNLHVWPYIRIKLYYYLLNIENTQIEEKSTISQNRKKKSIKATTKEVVKSFFDTRQFYKSLKSKEVIFVGAHFHRVLQNGVYFNRFFDPLIEKYNLKERAYTFEFQKYYPNSFNKNSVFHLANAIRNYKSFKRIEEKLITKPCTVNLINYDDFQEFLNYELGEDSIFKITENDLKKWSKKIIYLTPFFEKIIKKVKPNKIVFLSYYGFDDNYAFIYTARKMQIKVVDFQHGPQSNIHMAYSEWNKVPQDGFNIMPLEYWNWDDNSKKNIEAWANKTEVKAKVVGHPYIEYCLKHKKVENTKKQIML